MAETAVVSLLIVAAKPLAVALGNRVKEEIKYVVGGFKKALEKLQSKIDPIAHIVLNTTDVVQELEAWLRKVISILHDVENLLDVLAYEKQRAVVQKRRAKRSITGKTRFVLWPLKRLYFRRKIGRWISKIIRNIEEALKEAEPINQVRALTATTPARNSTVNDPLQQLRRITDMSLFVGRGSDVHKVVEKLCNPCQNCKDINKPLSVVAIVGLGGIGKTLLARNVYENEKIRNHFSERLWIASDSIDFNIDRILSKMGKFLGLGSYEDADMAIIKLQEYLGRKRYLLVLDDIWNTSQQMWDTMSSSLTRIGGSMESMVLTTTRNAEVANTMHAFTVQLSQLSEEDSWTLFKNIAFVDDEYDLSLETPGMNIAKKCKGVPLAIKSIGGLLQRKRNLSDWTTIEKSELWNISNDETGILPSLKLSYSHLSSSFLKKCFSLCAIWPKGTWFFKYELRDRWMALGLIDKSCDENLTAEDIGDLYFNELLGIFFLQVFEENGLGDAFKYTLHHLVYDLARSVATHERLYLEGSKKANNVLDIQHVTVVGHADRTSDFQDKLVLKNIRSIDICQARLPEGLLMHVKYLRVLSLEVSGVEVVPKSIARLKCLKYLDLARNPLKKLPECIMELYNLQSLILYNCKPLSELPEGLINLVNLRHLGLSFDLCPAEGLIRQLSQLQTLPPLRMSEGGFQISELGCLHHIRGELEIKGLEFIKCKLDAEKADLSLKLRVEQLRLIWNSVDNYINHEEVLEGLYPNPSLKLLLIKGYAGDKFPSWLMRMYIPRGRNHAYAVTLSNLIKIQLIDCGRCQQLPTLGHLPSLRILEITNMDSLKHISQEFYCGADLSLRNDIKAEGSFSSSQRKPVEYFARLEELRLSRLSNLEEWCEPGAGVRMSFPILEVLVLEDCPQLTTTPNKFFSLKELIIKNITSIRPFFKIIYHSSGLTSLKILVIEGVVELTKMPELVECTSLQTLRINNCRNLICLPESLSKLLSLELLEIRDCHSLVSLPSISNLGLLRELLISFNFEVKSAPEGLQNCKSLEMLRIFGCPKVETLPDLTGLTRLWSLNITDMTEMIIQPPDWLYTLPYLSSLHIGFYYELYEFPDISFLLKITSLQVLILHGWDKLLSLPGQLRYFTALQVLAIADFDNVEYLPDWLGNLSSFEGLSLVGCKKLKKLPSEEAMKRLTKLSYLKIEECPQLEEAININGTEHDKISHIEVEIINSTD